ncbi:hypothetical protein CB0940_04145 [Cercospora beticola]|uniref:Uncharacterized protein n=1 Tax=Cercospora beticola TaxID=122368 RepID=A0A2G5HMI3_CERBT|nr:hypothetical protein CB0940_04145 [Cercospora beticola]PIA93759.1 hypothetical protein CB0940_04145 [Cercospora beticola]
MNDDGSDVVGVCFEAGDLLGSVVVVDSELEVIAAAYYPVLSCDEATCSHRHIGQFERLYDRLRFVGPDVDVAAVECGEDPWLGGVEVNALDTLAARKQLPLQDIS